MGEYIYIYTGKLPDAVPEKRQGQRVVLDLVKDLKGRNITCDNFFTTLNSAMELLKRKSTIGTVRSNQTFQPAAMKQEIRRRPVFSSNFYFHENVSLVQYAPKTFKNVTIMSSLRHSKTTSTGEKKLPEMIAFYNQPKTGVDTLDQMVGSYTTKRKTNRWPFALFGNMIDVAGVNAYVLWNEANPERNKNKLFKRHVYS